MRYKTKISEAQRTDVLARVAHGERVAEVAKDMNITPSTVYAWIVAEKKANPTYNPPLIKQGPKVRDPESGESATPTPGLTIEEQIQRLSNNFVARLQELLIKQLTDNLRRM